MKIEKREREFAQVDTGAGQSAALHFVWAAGLAVAAIVVGYLLHRPFGSAVSILLSLLAVAAAGRIGGFWPAMLALSIAFSADWLFYFKFSRSFAMDAPRTILGLGLFLLGGFAISYGAGEARRAAASRRYTDHLFRRILADAPFPIMLHSEDGAVLGVSDTWSELSGYRNHEIATVEDWVRRAYPERESAILAYIRGLYSDREGRVESGERTIETASGELRIWSFRSSALGRDLEGRRLVLTLAVDVTERRRAEKEREAALARLQSTLNSIADGLCVLDSKWRFTYFSEAGARMAGVRSDEVVGRSIFDVFPEIDKSGFFQHYKEAMATGEPHHFEAFYGKPLHKWLEVHCYPAPDTLTVYFRDITERWNTQEALRERTAELDSLLEHAPIGFAFFDREHRYLRINERLAAIDGLTVEAHLGRAIRDVLPVNALQVDPVLDRVFSTGQVLELEIAGETPKEPGVLRHWLTGFYPVLSATGDSVKSVGASVVETTEQKRAAQKLMESNERLQLALDSAKMGTFEALPATGEVVWDDRSRALFGVGGDEALTLEQALQRIAPEDVPNVRTALEKVSEPRSTGRFLSEFRVRLSRGGVRWIVASGQSYFEGTGDGGRRIRLIGINHDVTERKAIELALAESDARFRIASSAAGLGLFEWDLYSGEVFWHNDLMYRIFGREESEGPLSAKNMLSSCIHPGDCNTLVTAVDETVRSHRPLRTVVRIRRGDSEERYVRFEGVVRNGAGRPRLLAIAQDITESRRTEDALRHNEAYLSAVIEALPIGIGTGDLKGRVLSLNAAGLRIHGFQHPEQMPDGVDDYVSEFEICYPDRRPMPVEEWPISRAVAGDFVSSYELILRRRNTAEERVLVYTVVPIRGGNRNVNVFVILDVTESRRAEALVRESELRYRTLFESMDEGFCVIRILYDEHGNANDYLFVEANPAFERHSGLHQAVGRRVTELLPSLEDSWFQILGTVADTGRSIRFENSAEALNRVFDLYAFRVGHAESRTVAVLFTDITSRKEDERRLQTATRESEAHSRLLDAVLQSLPVGVVIADATGSLLRWNKAHEALWGLTPTRNAQQLAEPRERAIGRALESRVAAGEVIEIEPFDGSGRRLVNIMSAPVTGRDGIVQGGVVVQMDVTERVQMEQALRESEDKFRTISENIPQFAWMTDADGKALWYNQRWYDYTGLRPSPDVSRTEELPLLMHPEDRTAALDKWKHSMGTGDSYDAEFRLRRHDSVYRWFLARAVPIRNSANRIVRWFGTTTDINEHKVAESALRRSNEDLQQFAYVASHDLQEPLRTVVSFSQLLQKRSWNLLDATSREYVNFVVEAGWRMSDLVRDLLVYSRATRDDERVQTAVLLDSVLDGVLRSLQPLLQESGAVIVREDRLPTVLGDATQLGQVFQNLLTNAVKYGREGVVPEIRISVKRSGTEWVISVQDNGQGFGREFADRIFGIFKRLHGRSVPGTGIGLAICKTVVERHGGRIWADSDHGAGACFLFTLPVLE